MAKESSDRFFDKLSQGPWSSALEAMLCLYMAAVAVWFFIVVIFRHGAGVARLWGYSVIGFALLYGLAVVASCAEEDARRRCDENTGEAEDDVPAPGYSPRLFFARYFFALVVLLWLVLGLGLRLSQMPFGPTGSGVMQLFFASMVLFLLFIAMQTGGPVRTLIYCMAALFAWASATFHFLVGTFWALLLHLPAIVVLAALASEQWSVRKRWAVGGIGFIVTLLPWLVALSVAGRFSTEMMTLSPDSVACVEIRKGAPSGRSVHGHWCWESAPEVTVVRDRGTIGRIVGGLRRMVPYSYNGEARKRAYFVLVRFRDASRPVLAIRAFVGTDYGARSIRLDVQGHGSFCSQALYGVLTEDLGLFCEKGTSRASVRP